MCNLPTLLQALHFAATARNFKTQLFQNAADVTSRDFDVIVVIDDRTWVDPRVLAKVVRAQLARNKTDDGLAVSHLNVVVPRVAREEAQLALEQTEPALPARDKRRIDDGSLTDTLPRRFSALCAPPFMLFSRRLFLLLTRSEAFGGDLATGGKNSRTRTLSDAFAAWHRGTFVRMVDFEEEFAVAGGTWEGVGTKEEFLAVGVVQCRGRGNSKTSANGEQFFRGP